MNIKFVKFKSTCLSSSVQHSNRASRSVTTVKLFKSAQLLRFKTVRKELKEKAQSKLTHRFNTLRINISSLCTFLLYEESEGCAACVL